MAGDPAASATSQAGSQQTGQRAQGRRLVLYGRAWCHLCEEMQTALAPLLEAAGAQLEVIDIDTDAALVARYDERVPVLVCEGAELCHYRLDAPRVCAALGLDFTPTTPEAAGETPFRLK